MDIGADIDTRPNWLTLTTAERRAIFEPAWVDGLSARDIAAKFTNVTRSAVIGAVHRAKLAKRPKDWRAHNSYVPKVKRNARPLPHINKPRVRKPMATPAFMSALPDKDAPSSTIMAMVNTNRPPLPGTTPIAMIDLPNRIGVLCRFPVDMAGVMGYCGAACGEKMYCKTHHAVMYRETDKFRMPKEARL